MDDPFLHLPERFAGYPLSLEEAVEIIGPGSYLAGLTLSIDERLAASQLAWRVVWANLATGSLHSFVQDGVTGSWFRIPQRFWRREKEQEPSLAPPDAMSADFANPSLAGQAIVVWRDDVERLQSRLDALKAKMAEERAGADHAPVPLTAAEREAEYRRVASALDEAGIAKRDTHASEVAQFWPAHLGQPPAADAIRSLMKGKRGGRPRG